MTTVTVVLNDGEDALVVGGISFVGIARRGYTYPKAEYHPQREESCLYSRDSGSP